MSQDALDDSRTWLIRFARRLPTLLGRNLLTADLAAQFDSLKLERRLERRFTLAIVGRMKAGKSTLLNALIECNLAPVGVTETTATINWFDGAREEDMGHFEIHWRDRSSAPERRPLAHLAEFSGCNLDSAAVDHLQFFAQTSFLDKVRIVDTPGFGSAVSAHEAIIGGYLSNEVASIDSEDEDESVRSRADAVLLVMSHSARSIDTKALDEFQKLTRFPGQGPYNSIAVLQKWEIFEGDPIAEAQRISAALKTRLCSRVADVLPISGLMHQVARAATSAQMEALTELARDMAGEALADITLDEAVFRADTGRASLYDAIVARIDGSAINQIDFWPILRFILRLIEREHVTNGQLLRDRLLQLSGIDDLRKMLNHRFFKLSELIRAGSVSMHALNLCEHALYRLKNEQARLMAIANDDPAIDISLAKCRFPDVASAESLAVYLSRHRLLRGDTLRSIETTVAEIEDWTRAGRRHFELLLTDIAQLEKLDASEHDFDDDEAEMLRSLFGLRGIDIWQRLGLEFGATDMELRERADAWLSTTSMLLRVTTKHAQRQILSHALQRLQMLHRLLDESHNHAI